MRKKRAITIKYIACHEYIGSESVSHCLFNRLRKQICLAASVIYAVLRLKHITFTSSSLEIVCTL